MYNVPNQTDSVVVRCLTVSPDGQFMASGDENGVVRLWEVQTGRLLRSWNLMEMVDSGEEKNEDGEGEVRFFRVI